MATGRVGTGDAIIIYVLSGIRDSYYNYFYIYKLKKENGPETIPIKVTPRTNNGDRKKIDVPNDIYLLKRPINIIDGIMAQQILLCDYAVCNVGVFFNKKVFKFFFSSSVFEL